MIHINTGEGKHKWVTQEELERDYPEIAKSLNRPIEDDKLRKIRIKKRIRLKDMADRTGLSVVQVSQIELGQIKDQLLVDRYIMVFNEG